MSIRQGKEGERETDNLKGKSVQKQVSARVRACTAGYGVSGMFFYHKDNPRPQIALLIYNIPAILLITVYLEHRVNTTVALNQFHLRQVVKLTKFDFPLV